MSINVTVQRSNHRTKGGFSIVEGSVAMGIVGIVFVSLLAGFTSGFSLIRQARENVRATQILQEKLEMMRLYNWDQITTNGFIPTNFVAYFDPTNSSTNGIIYSGKVTITGTPVTEAYSNNLRQVMVEVTWISGQITRKRQMATFVSRYGLQNYIY
jgi:uncharacterized protein (TIGR02598 family)